MRTLIIEAVNHPFDLRWWEWGKIAGLLLPLICLSIGVSHPLVWGVVVHFLLDFTFQSGQTVIGKARRQGWVLLYHAFISGGYAGLVVGGMAGLFVSVVIHMAVDSTNKFGLDEPAGPAIDQALHILTLVAIWRLL